MSPELWRKAEEAFLAALNIEDTGARRQYVESLDPPELRAEVKGMLRGHDEADEVLPSPGELSMDPHTGDTIGPYRIVRQIGRGGMGAVYEAERSDNEYRQRVAIKVLTSQIVGKDAIARFRMERQILAMLDHPNIVRLFDGGVTSEGAPYFAMELVEGEILTSYCVSRQLDVPTRLRLFQQVCSAIDYAHRHQVIHRDIKPANILVTRDGVAKVLDFGIAKALAPPEGSPAQALTTRFAPLTPGYASPEHIRGATVTTASDIYSLGLVLYELLTGVRARPNTDAASDPAFEPVRPSTAAPALRINRDLDSIVLKAIAPAPAERYDSAAEFGRDIARYLNGEPVQARQATVSYIVGRALRRHWGKAAAAVAIVALAGGALWWQARRTASEKQRRYEQVREVTRSMLVDMQNRIANLPGSLETRKSLTSQALGYLEALRKESAGDSQLEIDLARAYLQMASLQGGRADTNLGDHVGAAKSLDAARMLADSVRRREPRNTGALMTLKYYYTAVAMQEMYARNLGPAKEAAERALRLTEELQSIVPDNAKVKAEHAAALQVLGNIAGLTDLTRKKALFQQSLREIEELLQQEPDNSVNLRNAAMAAKNLASMMTGEEALTYGRRALMIDERLLQKDPKNRILRLDVSFDLSTLGTVENSLRHHDQAIAYIRRCVEIREQLVAEEPRDIRARDRHVYGLVLLASATNDGGRHREGLAAAEGAIAAGLQLLRDVPSPSPSDLRGIGYAFHLRADALQALGNPGAACDARRKAEPYFDASLQKDPNSQFLRDEMLAARNKLAACQTTAGSR